MKLLTRSLLTPLLLSMVACVQVTKEVTAIPAEQVPAQETVQDEATFSQAALDQMLAPIALYPDVLLSQVLIASTYPLEIVEASRWSRANPDLEGDDAVAAVDEMDWDPSIKALVAFPELLQLMDENLTWTRRLGDAFLLQEAQMMDTIQNLRQVALDEGSLEELEHVVVSQQEEVIYIEPRSTRIVYVPYYDTRYVYGSWWWYDYPPVCWYTRPVPYHSGVSIGFHWTSGIHFSSSFFYSDCYWPSRRVVVVKHHHKHHRPHYKDGRRDYHRYREAPTWRHNPYHRRGVRYPSEELHRRHDRHSASGITRHRVPDRDSRMDHRISRHPDQRPIPSETPVQLTRRSREAEQPGPVVSSRGTRQQDISSRPKPNASAPAISRSERANRLARSSEARRTVRTSQIARNNRVTQPKPVERSSNRVASSRKPEASQRSTIARTQSKPKPKGNSQSARQSGSSTNRSSSTKSSDSGNKTTYANNNNNSYSGSSNSSWKSNNKSYASNRPSRQHRADGIRKAIRPHQP
ncbi:MAG: DUF3300 domain-containing protein [Puniceicoccaceae bacterium]